MSEYEALQQDFVRTFEAIRANGAAVQRFTEGCQSEFNRLWQDHAELRDEINAVANRVESLTRAVMADPAEVAQAIVNDANRATVTDLQIGRCSHGAPHGYCAYGC